MSIMNNGLYCRWVDGGSTALKCLVSFLIPKVKKQADKLSSCTSIPYLLIDAPVRILFILLVIVKQMVYMCVIHILFVIFQNSTSFSEYVDLSNSHPYIVRLYDADETVTPSYQVIIEQQLVTCMKDMTTVLYIVFAVHFIFNITYGKASDLYWFLQEVVFGLPSTQKNQPPIVAFV